jgi:chemotaxis protein histidine kinase CheA
MNDSFTEDLKARFRETATVRVQAMRSLLETLGDNPADPAALDQLTRHFHALSGLGGTYGFARVSFHGDEGEGSIKRLSREHRSPTEKDVALWRYLVEKISGELC